MRCLKCVSLALLAMSAVSVAVAAPWSAGYKVFHQDQQTVSRRAYSYSPAAAAQTQAAAPTTAAPAMAAPAPATTNPAPAATVQPRSYRSNSYQPGVTYRGANDNRAHFWKEAR
jgi:hypothetical protein